MIQAGQEVDVGEIVLHHTADAYSIDFAPFGRIAESRHLNGTRWQRAQF